MREAVGGSMLFYIILIFIFIYIVFIGLIMNYAATYRASNYIITDLEETLGIAAVSGTEKNDELCNNLRSRNYHNNVFISCRNQNENDAIYKVKTYVAFELPLMGINFTIEIKNETKAIYGEACTIQETNDGQKENFTQVCR